MRKTLGLIFFPSLVFAIFVALGMFGPEILQRVGLDVRLNAQKQKTFFAVVQACTWLVGAAFLVRILNVFFWDRMVASNLERPVPKLLKDSLGVLVYLVAVTGILATVFEKDVTAIWATSSAGVVIVGFALRTIILDVFTGLAINLDSSYRIGDWLEIHNKDFRQPIYGRVQQINWRTTRLELENKNVVILPNSTMGVTVVTNFSLPTEMARFEILLTLDASVPVVRAMRVLLGAVRASIGKDGPVEDPPPKILIADVTELGVTYRVRYFHSVNLISPSTGRHTVSRSIMEHLRAAGLTPAYRRQDVFHTSMPERNLDFFDEHRALPDLLAKVDLFHKSLRPDELEQLAEGAPLHLFKAGDAVIRQGEIGASMFVLAEGLLHVFVENEKDKQRVKVAQLTPGEEFGEMSFLTGAPRRATIVAATDALVFEISKDRLHGILQRRPEVAEIMSHVVAKRQRGLTKALDHAAHEEHTEEKHLTAGVILSKIKHFFGTVLLGDDEKK